MGKRLKRIMISQPMAERTEEEIIGTRDRFIKYANKEGLQVINTLFTDEWYNKNSMEDRGVIQIPICFLAKSLESMSKCDIVYFANDWKTARGCRIEHEVAKQYGMKIIYEDDI